MQDYTPVTIGSRAGRGGGASATREAKAGQKKTPGSAGLSARLDNQTAAKLDSDEPKAPDTVGLVVGRVGLFEPRLLHTCQDANAVQCPVCRHRPSPEPGTKRG